MDLPGAIPLTADRTRAARWLVAEVPLLVIGHGVSATVRLSEADGWVSFSVEDDGTGFDPDNVERGAGLTNLTDRVAAVGGTLQIDAGPGRGTHIRGEIPLHADRAMRRRSARAGRADQRTAS